MKDSEKAVAVSKLNTLILKAVPKAKTIDKYGGTLYTLNPDEKEGQFCGIFQYEKHVQLAFSQGALLNDPSKLLEGSGKHRRHINLTADQEIDEMAFKRIIKEAARFSVK